MLTRKVYNKLAEVVREIPDTRIRHEVANRMSGILGENNPRFDYTKWFNACTRQ